MEALGLCVVALLLVWMGHWVYRWRNPVCQGKLPPGSMGLPLIGETLQFLKPQPTMDIHPFLRQRMNRYGSFFKTNLMGQKVIVSTDPNFSYFIFQQEGKSVEFWYLDSFMKLIGRPTSTGDVHKYLRNMILEHFGTGKQKEKLLNAFEDMARTNLAIWSELESVEVKEVVTNMSFGLSLKKIMNCDQASHSENLKDKFASLMNALISIPLNFPGTAFHKCLKDKKKAIIILMNVLKERVDSEIKHGDILDDVIADMKKDKPFFTLKSAAYFIYAILFGSFETISLTLTLVLKFVSEDPSVLNDLTEEHELILKNRESLDSALTWDDYKSMVFTSHVIDEALRLGNIVPMVFRRATRDIHVQGYTIPAGWIIMVCPQAIHLNPDKYQDAQVFNPWRWKGQGSNIASRSFMAFGGGMRQCAGAEFAKMQISVVLHFLVTKYRWNKIKGGEVVKIPGVVFPNGLHIKFTKKE